MGHSAPRSAAFGERGSAAFLLSCVRHRQELQRLAAELLNPALLGQLGDDVAHLVGRVPEPRERDAHLRPRRGRVPPLGEVELGYLEAGLELHQQPLRGALADPGHHRERGEVVLEQGAAQAGGRMHRQHRQRQLGADAGGGDQRFERVALVARREAVEHHRVLTHVQVCEQERGIARVQRGQRAGRHERPIPDAPDLDQHLAGGGALDHGSPHRPDHLASSLATAAAMASASRGDAPREGAPPWPAGPAPAAASGARHQWQSASASASAASGGSGTSAS